MSAYEPRHYRLWTKEKDLVSFNVVVRETDLFIQARRNLRKKALAVVSKQRTLLEKYIERHPGFVTALEPFPVGGDAPHIVKEMAVAAEKVGVGPMAAVAGTFAEFVGRELLNFSSEVIVENGGDIFLKNLKQRLVGVYAGNTPFTGKIALKIEPEETPLGVCTSSGTVGHSLSFGSANAAIVVSPSTPLADAAATAIGNLVKADDDINRGIEFAKSIDGLRGVAIIKGDRMALWGQIEIVRR
jgi:ApbE superfamily uncharacterized protein (UPF0280 family)